MKMNSKILSKPIKDVKKVVYRGKITKFRRLIIYMIIAGILLSIAYFCRYAYVEYAVSNAHIVLSYPQIADSQYPDGSRFTYYDFISDDRLQEALNIMQEKGKYKYFTIDDIRDKFYVYGYLESSASSNVSYERSEGNDFSYVANEYGIVFTQPHDYKNPDFIKKFFVPNDSEEFLDALVEVNKKYIAEQKGGIDGFKTVTKFDDTSNYDYDEKVDIYKAKKTAIASYLGNLDKEAPKFVSKESNMSIKDIKNKYDLLITNKLDVISDYLDSTCVSKNPEITANKIRVNIENNRLKYNKVVDESQITEYAIVNYDHTFTENLINVVIDKTQGLYQARPKTAFDIVVVQKNRAKEDVATYGENLLELGNDLGKYIYTEPTEEMASASQKCESLFNELDNEYNTFTGEAQEVVSECLYEVNKNFVSGTVEPKSMFTMSLIMKMGVVFLIGMMIMFLLCVYISVFSDRAELKRRQKVLKEIKKATKGE